MSDIELLIELVRERPCLYDKSHPHYKDVKGIRQNNWIDISRKLREAGYEKYTDGDAAKVQWKNVRDSYAAAKKRISTASRSGAASSKDSTWRYWNNMIWLDDFLAKKDTTSNVPVEERGNAIVIPDIERPPRPHSSPAVTSSHNQPSTSSATSTTAPATRKRRRPSSPDADAMFFEKMGEMTSVLKGAMDESANFGQMVAAQHRSLSAEQQRHFVKEVQKAYLAALSMD